MENPSFPLFLKTKTQTNVALVGFSGVGKSTVGKKLAGKLNYSFIDLDQYFEQKYCFSIPTFFQQFGEPLFRELERKVLEEVLQKDKVVIATGGGTACFFDNMALINGKCTSIYLQMAEKSIFERLSHSKRPRPLTSSLSAEELRNYIHSTLEKREPFYLQAHLTLKGENFDIDEALRLLNESRQK